MSAFYDLASLVLVPSGTKAQKIYAQKPLTTDGQLAFTRSTTATRVNSAGLIEASAINVPRLDYLNSTCPKLLLEPSRTNLILQSSAFDNAAWTKGNSPTITTNIATAPDGTISADGIQSADAANYKTITQTVSVSANGTLTLSFFVKKETSETFFGGFTMYFKGGTNKIVYGIVNAVAGTVTYASSTLTATTKVESYGNYWRIASTATDNGSNTSCDIGYYGTLSTNGTALNTGAGSVRTIWGFQAEAGAYATSYIPTLGAAVTRGADAASKSSINALIGGTSGTIFFEIKTNKTLTSTNYKQFFYYSDASAAQAYMYLNGSNYIVTNPSLGGFTGSLQFQPDTTYKVAIAYATNDFKLYINGVERGSSTSGTPIDAVNLLSLGSYAGSVEFNEFVFSQYIHFPTRLSNADLAALTA